MWTKIKRYLGVWAWIQPLNWTDPTEGDWAPGWLANYVVVAEALALLVLGVSKLL